MERFRERGLINLLTVKYTNSFEKDYKLIKKRGLNLKLLQDVVAILANEQELPEKYKDHYLKRKYKRIYKIDKGELLLTAYRTGFHSDLF